ncbi:up-regulator of cell proliferation-like [Chrysemys picta bellii]|uniref:up-regulator of cell proliferation-like n=1 Tax=Chrysemys picta bellii TaxID=8478 RepID=UPI0032B199F6
MEKTVTDLLLETLEELGKDDLKRFKWKLKEIKVENQYNNIPWGKLETARPVDVAKELLNYYGEHYRVEVTIQVLRSIHRRDLTDRLTKATQADVLNLELESMTPQNPEPGETDGSNLEQESNMQRMPASFKKRRRTFQGTLFKLKLKKYRSRKLTLRDLQKIGPESLKDWTAQTLGDLPWYFLRKVMALNGTTRNTSLGQGELEDEAVSEDEEELDIEDDFFSLNDTCTSDSLHPLDLLCAVLLCSDSFLQQEILSRMSMCQFALPLLLPALDTPRCTLMLWAMRDIVRKWRPHSLAESRGFREESLVLTSMPTISFVRLGSCSFSKSQLLNEVLSPSQQYHDFFIHRDMESGNIPWEIADGLVEISWYFPNGSKNSDLFPEPIAVTNLHGDIESHQLQFSFLMKVSTLMIIFVERLSEREYALLSSLKEAGTKVYFMLSSEAEKSKDMLGFLKKLVLDLKLSKSHLLFKQSTTNQAQLVKKLRSTIGRITKFPHRRVTMEDMAETARELGIQVDEDCEECQRASKCVKEITAEIKDVAKYKREMLRLQGDLGKTVAKVEKELCRIRKPRTAHLEKYESELKEKLVALHKEKNQWDLTDGLVQFISGIACLSQVERCYFLKWMKLSLDHITRGNLASLQAEYKEKCKTSESDPQELSELGKIISARSLGSEHFMRELGQFYDAEHSRVKQSKITESQRQFIHLPGIAADLMLEGFPMELIDGDASNIPLQWVTDVLTQLHAKLGGRSRTLVLTVLGGQSTGKSTLLNTMFGLQFAVSSGRCTRGVFMSLIKVAENFQQELGCDFILVIDTEGLKSPELARLEDSYQHDNELATLVIGLSDITIVNMAMENATEMKYVLQIVVHAFLRMEEIGHKPNCQFVHQNVSDVSAHDQNMRDRKHLLEQLDEMTKAAAKMETQIKEMAISDIMDYDPEKHNWYIPGLWHGVPPIAPVNIGYSERVCELKNYLFDFTKSCSANRSLKDIPQFIERLRSLWNTIKHEHFSFSFKSRFVDEVYNQLSMNYAEWEWGFRKEMHLWVSEKETFILNQPAADLNFSVFKNIALEKLQYGEQKIMDCLQQYFARKASDLHLMEKYKEDFIRSTKTLKNDLKTHVFSKCEEAILTQIGRLKSHDIHINYMKIIEGEIDQLLANCRRSTQELDDKKLESKFETVCHETSLCPLQNCQVEGDMEAQLRKDLMNRRSAITEMLQGAGSLKDYRMNSFKMKSKYLEKWLIQRAGLHKDSYLQKAKAIAKSLMDQCQDYIQEKVISKTDYDKTYCRELLRMINERLQEADVRKCYTNAFFEVDLKLHVLGEAAHEFQKMHEVFIQEHNPQKHLEKFKPQYFSRFKDLYLGKDSCQKRARDFCEHCLKPALVDYVKKRITIEIVDDFLSRGQAIKYGCNIFFQFTVEKKLLEDGNFNNYLNYINSYEEFVQSWIHRHLLDYYNKTDGLVVPEREILATIVNKVRGVLEHTKDIKPNSASAFLDDFCKALEQDLVISKDSLVGILFKNTAMAQQFSADIQTLLPDLEQQILSEFKELELESKLSNLPLKPQDEMFKQVSGFAEASIP